ncbi:MAG TPA: hypothetical protein VNO52_13825 [Methylomirabilota bacterium]|nr:hypothetical protein [Methylomirabilota bacterium]
MIWIEPGNGDNAPLALEKFQAAVPVVRMLFQAPATGGVDLLYGNARAAAPRYDLSLVAPQVLAAAAVTATLADGDPTVPAAPQMTRMAPVLFYVVRS